MPTYEYRCPDGHTFDVFQKMSDDPVASCPECGKEAERVISGGAGFLFKGEGFYITDYRSKDYQEKARAEKPGAAPDGKSGEKATGSGSSSSGEGGATGSGGGTEGSAGSSSAGSGSGSGAE